MNVEIPILFVEKEIFGVMHLPKIRAPLIIMCHGWGANKIGTWQGLFVKAAREFCEKGYAVLRFDFRGSGDSGGSFEEQTLETMTKDLNYVLNNLDRNDVDADRVGLIGHSLGGKAAIKVAKNKRIKCLMLWSTPALHQDVFSKAFVDEVKEKKCLLRGGFEVNINQLDSCLKFNGLNALREIRVPVLIVNGSEDESVPISHAKRVYECSNKPKKLVVVNGADHAFSSDENKKELIKETAEWFRKWLPPR